MDWLRLEQRIRETLRTWDDAAISERADVAQEALAEIDLALAEETGRGGEITCAACGARAICEADCPETWPKDPA